MSDHGTPTFQDRQKALAHLVSLVPAADESMSIGQLIQHAYAWAAQTGSAAQQEIHGLVETLTRTPQVEALPPKSTDDPLVVLVYLLLRDHIHAGVFESLVTELGQGQEASLTNPYLAAYAMGVAERLRYEEDPQAVQRAVLGLISPEQRDALADCVSIAQRMASSYEFYGGVELGVALPRAQKAIDNLGITIEEVEEP
jgi:rhamnogalacturonyl hydrolase YesR